MTRHYPSHVTVQPGWKVTALPLRPLSGVVINVPSSASASVSGSVHALSLNFDSRPHSPPPSAANGVSALAEATRRLDETPLTASHDDSAEIT